ncbi:MAG TPA: DUF502 domain-containing protein [Steroidobacteraceae bacterium]|nr:DUF502 domain-containing protein [Steroidobacteraceae bacterium]
MTRPLESPTEERPVIGELFPREPEPREESTQARIGGERAEEQPVPGPRGAAKRNWSLRRYLVAGILVWVPILATIWVVGFIVDVMDRTLLLLPEHFRPKALFGFSIPGFGIVFAFVVVLLTGLAVTNLVGRQLVAYWEELLQRIPLVRSVYSGVKSFAESVLTSSHSFRQVVAVEYPRPGIWSIGFVTAEDVAEVSAKTGEALLCVFISPAPNPTAGFIILVPRSQVIPLDMSVDAAMRMIVTCGVVTPPFVPAQRPAEPRRT